MAYYSERRTGKDTTFPGGPDYSDVAPPPSAENPGQFFPSSDDRAANAANERTGRAPQVSESLIGNPFLMRSALEKVDRALLDVVSILEQEESSNDGSYTKPEHKLLEKFQSWRKEVVDIRASQSPRETSRSQGREGSASKDRRSIRVDSEGPTTSHEGGLFVD